MKTTKELNSALATEVMGWDNWNNEYWCTVVGRDIDIVMPISDWNPAHDLNHAFMCLDKWKKDTGSSCEIRDRNGKWRVSLWLDLKPTESNLIPLEGEAENEVLARAICEAMLQVVIDGD